MTRILLSVPHLTGDEEERVIAALRSNWIAPLGPEVEGFEADFAKLTGMRATATSSGTAALHLALCVLGISAGDTVWTSTLTFVATANAVSYTGATPVFLDSDTTSWNMDPDLLEEALNRAAQRNELPKAVVVVDLYGQCADYDRIVAACQRYEIPVIEDAAESLGATYKGKAAGSLGDIGIFSFNGNKIITTSGGGMFVSANQEWVERCQFLATQAREPAPHYQHTELGYNYRLSNILASLGRAQLGGLTERVSARRRVNQCYRTNLSSIPGLSFMPEAGFGMCTFWLTALTIDPGQFGATRESLRKHLDSVGIEARPVWKPMHLQPLYADAQCIGGSIAEDLFERGLCLPSSSSLRDEELTRITDAIIEFQGRY